MYKVTQCLYIVAVFVTSGHNINLNARLYFVVAKVLDYVFLSYE